MLKNKMQFVVLSFIFAFLLSGCSTKKNKQEWEITMIMRDGPDFMPEDEDNKCGSFFISGKVCCRY